jgi:SP family general alpha glucoside:H+ symporter-like MFS transporter
VGLGRIHRAPTIVLLTFWGLVILTVILLLAGGMTSLGTVVGIKACVALILLYCYLFNATIGATAYIAMSEMGPTRLRNKTAALAVAMKAVWEVTGNLPCFWRC